MQKGNPKKYVTKTELLRKREGVPQRLSYQQDILQYAPVFPKPLEYGDIDKEFYRFVDEMIDLAVDGKKVPTFTLFSNQRFSEYSQSWNHTDEDGNLLMDFKTVNREKNPKSGDNQGGLWNIPGNRDYTLLRRTVLDDNGTECYEVYTMKQPYCIDMSYEVSFVTARLENLNDFNQRLNDLFKARQCYIRPNNHYIPMVMDNVNDQSQYSIEDVKFYVQSATIKVMAYIIGKDDFKVKRIPKRVNLYVNGKRFNPKPEINLEEYSDRIGYKIIDVTIDYKPWHDRAEFVIDTDMVVESIQTDNVRIARVYVNGTQMYTDKEFKVKDGDTIRVVIRHINNSEKSTVTLHGYNPNSTFIEEEVPELVSDDPQKFENIIIE
ncbi:MAG: hypothetical protein LUD72_14240 [Bacteroidales bacterium]|nr:hypothetical protein [Bacteroidales bacterium]